MATPIKRQQQRAFLVVALDFGTTYSGYAFSFASDFNQDPRKISCNQWHAGSNQGISMKTPTVLLLRWHEDRKEFDAEGFGYEAENKYASLVESGADHEDYFLARRFKMDLYKQTAATGLGRSLQLQLGRNKTISAMRVFSLCIGHLKAHFWQTIEKRGANVKTEDIRWVLTVPAIWTDGAKQFMREAAVMAGIDTDLLTIALEPEAASLYCLHLPALDSDHAERESRFPEGTKYMVVDCGGGTIDICVHEVVGKHAVAEKHVASGGNWGGTAVDEKFLAIWIDIVGKVVFRQFEDKHQEELMEMYREFEFKKRSLRPDQDKLTVRLPAALVDLHHKTKGVTFEDAISSSKYAGQISVIRDKLRIDITLIHICFDEPVRKTVEHVKAVLKDKNCRGVNTVVLVGGFAESTILQEAVKNNLPKMKVIIPEDPGLAVVKGAVVFGHDPLTVQARFAKYTYGMSACAEARIILEPEGPPRGKRSGRKGRKGSSQPKPEPVEVLTFIERHAFDIHVKKGQRIRAGESQESRQYRPMHHLQRHVILPFFTSTDTDPRLVTEEGCSHIGSVLLEMSEEIGCNRPITVQLTFGGTEIEVSAVEKNTGKETKASLNCLL